MITSVFRKAWKSETLKLHLVGACNVHLARGLLFHIGADTGEGNLKMVGPVFPLDDNRFEYVPSGSPENAWGGCDPRTYRDISARNSNYGTTLADFLPNSLEGVHPHIDPEFEGLTYGEPDQVTRRINTVRGLRPRDILFFVASLSPYDPSIYRGDRSAVQKYQIGKKNKFVIGFFKISGTAFVLLRKGSITITRMMGRIEESNLRKNHHYTRMCSGKTYNAIIWVGDPFPRSALLHHAIRLTEKYDKTSFLLNSLGKRLLGGRERDTLRGGRWVSDLSIIVDEILIRNPEITQDYPELRRVLLDR